MEKIVYGEIVNHEIFNEFKNDLKTSNGAVLNRRLHFQLKELKVCISGSPFAY